MMPYYQVKDAQKKLLAADALSVPVFLIRGPWSYIVSNLIAGP
jgi:hypothetical protein